MQRRNADLTPLPELADDPTLKELNRSKVELERELESAKVELRPGHPTYGKTTGELAKVRERLEERGVTQWAAAEFSGTQAIVSRGDDSLSIGAYADAARAYEEASRRFEAIAASAPAALGEALEAGGRALAEGDSEAAAAAFTLAATIQPENRAAANGLRRAEALVDPGAREVRFVQAARGQRQRQGDGGHGHRDRRRDQQLDEREAVNGAE